MTNKFSELIKEAMARGYVHKIEIDGVNYLQKSALIDEIIVKGLMDPELFPQLVAHLDKYRTMYNLGQEVEFNPPAVNYTQRGIYYKIIQPPTQEMVTAVVQELDLWSNHYNQRSNPEVYLYDYKINEMTWLELYPGELHDDRMQLIAKFVINALTAQGWTYNITRNLFTAWREFTRDNHGRMDTMFDTQEWNVKGFYQIVAEDAYGKTYYTEEENYPPEFQAYVTEMAEKYNYMRKGDRFVEKPVALPDNILDIGHQILSNQELLVYHEAGYQVMPLQNIRQALFDHGINLKQLKIKFQLMGSTGAWAEALVVNGFDLYVEEYWADDWKFESTDHRFKCVQKRRMQEDSLDHSHKAQFAQGLPVTLVGFILNSNTGELVYLNMVGPINSVKANWSALMQKRTHYYAGITFKVATASNHKRFEGTLPSGLHQIILVNHEASPSTLTPLHDKFYLLTNDRSDAMPKNFVGTLDKFL